MGAPKKPLSGDDLQIVDALAEGDWEGVRSLASVLAVLSAGSLTSVAFMPLKILASTAALLILAVAVFAVARHFTLCHTKAGPRASLWAAASSQSVTPDTSKLPAVYFTYILGSGGHTGELCELIKQSYCGHENLHRRYILTSGDTHSPHAVAQLETLIRDSPQPSGTSDVLRVRRARRVHQPLWTAPFSSLLSALSIVKALVREPRERSRKRFGTDFRYPHVIVTNGPGTGFVVCLVVHLLKMFFLVPQDRLKVVYIETWAHISTLSLTGKLFYYTDIADLYLVQHRQLAESTGKPCLQLFKPPIYARGGDGEGLKDDGGK